MALPLSQPITPLPDARSAPPFGANEMRLNRRQWCVVIAIVLAFILLLPPLWSRIERFDTGPDYRIPYPLSSDYWLYQRRLQKIGAATTPVVGDSVVWGEYVRPDGTLTHFLNQEMNSRDRFANCGVNGLFPLSLEGLMASYSGPLAGGKVIVHCNLLWMSSPKADLSIDKEETFNHSALVPQFYPRIPCYRANAETRLGALANRAIPFFGLVSHIDNLYFDQVSIPRWTLEQDDSDPPNSPNAWRNPLSRITLAVSGEPKTDPLRGPSSPRHKPWNSTGATPTHFDWVPLQKSLQWQAFQRTVRLLQGRGCSLFVVVGPFNEHMIAADQIATYHAMRNAATAWLSSRHIPFTAPPSLPSALYADASHPLTAGYALLAHEIFADSTFRRWVVASR